MLLLLRWLLIVLEERLQIGSCAAGIRRSDQLRLLLQLRMLRRFFLLLNLLLLRLLLRLLRPCLLCVLCLCACA